MARPPVDPRLWRYARSARRYLVLSVLLSLVITGSIVVAAVLLARVLAGVVTEPGQRTFGAWSTEILVLAVVLGVRVLATWWQSRLGHRAGAGVVAELETAVLTAGAQLPPRELETRRTELAVVVGTGLSGLRGYLTGYLPALLLAVLVPPIVLAVIAIHDPISGLIVVVTLPLIPIFMILIGLLTQGRAEATLAATTRLSDQLLDLFAGMPTLRALGREAGAGSADRISGGDGVRSGAAEADAADSAELRRTTMVPRVRELGDALRQRTMRALRIAFLSSMVLEMLATLSVALIAVSIGLRLVFGEMSLYAGLVALILAPEVYLPLRMVGERFHAAQDGMAAADRAFAILESDSLATDSAQADDSSAVVDQVGKSAAGGQRSRPDAGSVGVRDASSGRSDTDGVAGQLDCVGSSTAGGVDAAAGGLASSGRSDVGGAGVAGSGGVVEVRGLSVRARGGFAPEGLSAVCRPGEVTVFAGANGSGKSTAVQAILGLIEPDRGAVTVDGVDVRELDSAAWWARVAWLPQRPVLVPGTLRENLELFGAQAEMPAAHGAARIVDDLEAACVATGFDAILDELPDRWDTVVGFGGVGLSLGQRQRLALTRVLAADRPLLLLDEPTAHLDTDSEAAVLTALRHRARAGTTVVLIGHRPTVLAAADHVIQVRAATNALTEVRG
ncbi:ABC transporter permease/ATP-binding protein CydD [Nocardia brasiliensis NBRC 14402]|uniref:ABC transporter ATP-binding protein/permease n=2 Tax=Nocardia brasiliensis TaxID=37326 RepID=UPI0002D63696|nr:ATP-binding cassette domain-containing protein [Nocardia brasiliensis]ASF10289.1 cysteine ABC transporter ATP-binding protein [Nocardia brasiliensis]GAJ85258.1 ABC transporter permease/ATP-binding protein CydD [Nocardia brasiliensis NBRC 14402]SUB11243.1 ATP-binding/permease protein CydD [Nocardia brasiliensis]